MPNDGREDRGKRQNNIIDKPMASTENPAREPVEPTADSPAPALIAAQSEVSVPENTPVKPTQQRLAESQLEAAHAELPPLSSISNGVAADGEQDGGNGPEDNGTRPNTRRGLRRGQSGRSGKNNAEAPAIGAVENPAEISENLSGKYANGYEGRPARREFVPSPVAEEPRSTAAETSAPKEFVPPVSKDVYKAEMNPDRERQAREERRRSRPPREGKTSQKEFFGERREDRPGEWSPQGRRNPHQKLEIAPPEIPEQKEDGLLEKIKKFFSGLFAGKPEEVKKKRDYSGDKKDFQRGGNRRRRGGRGRRGGEFRQDRGERNPRNPNREGRNRPHARGGNYSRSDSQEG